MEILHLLHLLQNVRAYNTVLSKINNHLAFESILADCQGNGSFRPRVVSAQSRFGPGSFPPGSFRPWVVLAQFGGSFRPFFFLNYQACYRRSTKYYFG